MYLMEGLAFNESLSREEKAELFVLLIEPELESCWKKVSKNHSILSKLFRHLDRMQCYHFQFISKVYNTLSERQSLGNLQLIVHLLRRGRELESEVMRNTKSTCVIGSWNSKV